MIKDAHRLLIMIFFFILSFTIMAVVPLPVVWAKLGFELGTEYPKVVFLGGVMLTSFSVIGMAYVLFPELFNGNEKSTNTEIKTSNQKLKNQK